MNKKPGLLFAVSLLAIIVLAVSFGMNYGENPVVHLRPGIDPSNVLYVCPAQDATWHNISVALSFAGRYAYLLFFFAVFVLLFSWGWALYQNLLKDKFNADAYKNSWDLTKLIFWLAVVFTIVTMTPNHFRRIEIKNHGTDWVLCENSSVGAKAVNPRAVTVR